MGCMNMHWASCLNVCILSIVKLILPLPVLCHSLDVDKSLALKKIEQDVFFHSFFLSVAQDNTGLQLTAFLFGGNPTRKSQQPVEWEYVCYHVMSGSWG